MANWPQGRNTWHETKPRRKVFPGPPAHDAKVNVGGGSRSAFADAKVGAANANTPSSLRRQSWRIEPSNEVSQILKSKRNAGNNNYARNSGSNSFGQAAVRTTIV